MIFKRIFRRFKNVIVKYDKDLISLGLIGLSTSLAVFKCDLAYIRLFRNVKDLFFSLWCYICKVFLKIETTTPGIAEIHKVDLSKILPFDIDVFVAKFEYYWDYFFSYKNFLNYCMFVFTYFALIISVLSVLIPIFLLIVTMIKRSYLTKGDESERYKETKQLIWFKERAEPVIAAVINYIKSYFRFLGEKENRIYVKAFVIIWLFNLNIVTIAIGIIAYYFYFISVFSFTSFPIALIKLLIDVVIMLSGGHWLFWATFVYVIVAHFLKKRAYRILQHNEMKNRGFINSQPLVTLTCGTMGSKKTTSAVDMTLSTSVMFKDKALELMMAHDMKFPNFPWLRFEDDLKKCYENHINRQALIAENRPCGIRFEDTIYNLASTKYWVASKAEEWFEYKTVDKLWGYDFNKYPMTYNDDLVIYHLFDILIEYAQLYLIYIVQCSYIFGNLSVREDMYSDDGYLPLWNTDFFHRTPQESACTSRFAKIFDYDMFRLGKKMIENNVNSGAFEFGVVILTEIGKERKNNLENRENKKKSEECNQNNDLFNTTLKMIRHRATVSFYPFVRIITDEQRPESWGSDARDLCSVLELGESSDLIILYRGLFFDGFIHDIIYPKFQDFYTEMRNLRGDNTLLVYLLKNILAKHENRYEKLQNRFGFYILPVLTMQGNLEGAGKQCEYYVSRKKTYSGRFATDSHADIFERMAFKSGIGLYDFVEYQDIRQIEDEMKLQNSYFYLDMSRWSQV